jgi:4-hydroxyphenylpyruvate dioxygenase-like putative hemolysin
MTVDWELDHVGNVVKNLDEAVKHYQLLNMELQKSQGISTSKLDYLEGSISKTLEFKSCFVQNEGNRIKLIQPLKEDGLFSKYLKEHGGGVYIFEFCVKDLPAEKSRLAALGIPVIARTRRADGSDMEVLFDTRKYGNIILALFSEPVSFPRFKRALNGRWRPMHMGVTVKDIDGYIEFFQAIGFKSQVEYTTVEPLKFEDTIWEFYGKKPVVNVKSKGMGVLQNKSGTFVLEVIQPLEGKDLYREFMDRHGEGMDHIHFGVDNLEEEAEKMSGKGFPAIMAVRTPADGLFETFYDTRNIGGFCIALWKNSIQSFEGKPES